MTPSKFLKTECRRLSTIRLVGPFMVQLAFCSLVSARTVALSLYDRVLGIYISYYSRTLMARTRFGQ